MVSHTLVALAAGTEHGSSLLLVDVKSAFQILNRGLLLTINTVLHADDGLVEELVETITRGEAPLSHCICIAVCVATTGMVTAVWRQIARA